MTYSEKLKDPRWQKRRLELLEAAGWKCFQCKTESKTLHVHHGVYRKCVEPWEYESEVLHVLCEECHTEAEEGRQKLYDALGKVHPHTVAVLGESLEHIRSGKLLSHIFFELALILRAADTDLPETEQIAVLKWLILHSIEEFVRVKADEAFKKGMRFATREKLTSDLAQMA